jgi:hypothetical protein
LLQGGPCCCFVLVIRPSAPSATSAAAAPTAPPASAAPAAPPWPTPRPCPALAAARGWLVECPAGFLFGSARLVGGGSPRVGFLPRLLLLLPRFVALGHARRSSSRILARGGPYAPHADGCRRPVRPTTPPESTTASLLSADWPAGVYEYTVSLRPYSDPWIGFAWLGGPAAGRIQPQEKLQQSPPSSWVQPA